MTRIAYPEAMLVLARYLPDYTNYNLGQFDACYCGNICYLMKEKILPDSL